MVSNPNLLTKGNHDFSKRDIVEILVSIKPIEDRLFNRFIKRNGTSSDKKLWNVLKKYKHKGFKVKDGQLFSKVQPKKEFNRNLFNGWVVSLSELVKEFIVLQEFRKDKIGYSNAIANALLLRGAPKSYKKLNQKNDELIKKESFKSIDLFNHLHEKEYIHRQYAVRYDPSNQNGSMERTILFNDIGYIGRNLRYYTSVLIRQRVGNEKINLPKREAFIEYVANFDLEEYPTIQAYYLAYLLLLDVKNYARYQNVRDYVITNIHRIELNEARQFLLILANVCFWNIREGGFPPNCQENYIEERFKLIKILVEGDTMTGYNRNYWKSVGAMSSSHFHYIIQSAVDYGELGWAIDFMTNYLPFINEKFRRDLEILNRAYLNFHSANYKAVIPDMVLMNSDGFKFFHYYNETKFRTLQLKSYYVNMKKGSLKNLNFVNSRLTSYQNFVNKQERLNEESKQQRSNFVKALKLLVRYKFNTEVSNRELITKVNKHLPSVELPWLLKEVNNR